MLLIIVIGRPELLWENKSQRSKERAAKILSDGKNFGHLYRALQKSAKKSRKSLVPVLDRLNKPGSGREVSNIISKSNQQPTMLSTQTALALIASCSLSQTDYQKIRNIAKSHNADIFPPYRHVIYK